MSNEGEPSGYGDATKYADPEVRIAVRHAKLCWAVLRGTARAGNMATLGAALLGWETDASHHHAVPCPAVNKAGLGVHHSPEDRQHLLG